MKKKRKKKRSETRLLAIDPMSRGFAWVVFEGPERLVDWGIAHVREKKRETTLRRVSRLLRFYQPDVVVLEDPDGPGSRRRKRLSQLLRSLRQLVVGSGVRVWLAPPATVKGVFAAWDAVTKEEMARVVADRFPALAPRLPPHRKIWMSEDDRINLFDATALAVTHFESKKRKRGSRRQA